MQNKLSPKTVVGNRRTHRRTDPSRPRLVRVGMPTAKLEVDVDANGGRIETIIVTCMCGETHTVHCDYTDSTTQNDSTIEDTVQTPEL